MLGEWLKFGNPDGPLSLSLMKCRMKAGLVVGVCFPKQRCDYGMSAIGTFRTSQPWCVMSAVEVRADDGRVFVNFRLVESECGAVAVG